MQMGLKVMIKINKLTSAQCSAIHSSWTSNQQQIKNKEIALNEIKKEYKNNVNEGG